MVECLYFFWRLTQVFKLVDLLVLLGSNVWMADLFCKPCFLIKAPFVSALEGECWWGRVVKTRLCSYSGHRKEVRSTHNPSELLIGNRFKPISI